MPKERFHIYLADELLKRCAGTRTPDRKTGADRSLSPHLRVSPSSRLFLIGAVSPDIFFYDLPSFSLSPMGDALHDLMDREGISVIYDWIARTSSSQGHAEARMENGCDDSGTRKSRGDPAAVKGDARGEERKSLLESAHERRDLWALGFACHFLVDAAWHPVINDFSRGGCPFWKEAGSWEAGGERRSKPFSTFPKGGGGAKESLDFGYMLPAACYCRSEIECHRLLESELEALWLAGSPTPGKYNELLEEFKRDRELLFEVASYYHEFLEFAGISSRAGPVPAFPVSVRRIVRCFLWQNFLLRLFSSRMLGRKRDRLLSFPPTRSLGVLVNPVRTLLPPLFSRSLPEDRNPFSSYFLEHALTSLQRHLWASASRLS